MPLAQTACGARSTARPFATTCLRPSGGRPVGRHCVVARAVTARETEEMRPGQYGDLARLMVTDFYQPGDGEVNTRALKRLESDQLADMKRRYVPRSGPECSVRCVRDEGGRTLLAGVTVGVTPFDGDIALGRVEDLKVIDPSNKLRPVVANLVVRKQARRRGLAQLLVRACEEDCRSWGYDEIWLLVESTNARAIKLYRKLGFKSVGAPQEASAFKVEDGDVKPRKVRNIYMRKSLKGGIVGAIENADWTRLAFIVALGAAAFSQQDMLIQLLSSLVGSQLNL